MGIKKYGPYTPSRRNMTGSDFSEITKSAPERSLVASLKKNAGRNAQGKITVSWKKNTKDVDLDPKDQGKNFMEMARDRLR